MGRLFDGTCRLCGEEYKGQGMTSHVKRCLTEHANLAASHHGLLVGLRADGVAGRFWAYALVRPEGGLEDLDTYLRELWFQADGRVSVFAIEDRRYVSSVDEAVVPEDEEEEAPVEPMSVSIGSVLRPRMEFEYLYDPADPTPVELTVYDPYPIPDELIGSAEETTVATVARSELGEVSCSTCDSPASDVCMRCLEEEDSELGPLVCQQCRDQHDGELRPIHNSPRVPREDASR